MKLKKVELNDRNAPIITVLGADLMDGTPIYDIKPYIPFTDAHAGAKAGFIETNEWKTLKVVIPETMQNQFSEEELVVLRKVLAQDPRPQYKEDGDKVGNEENHRDGQEDDPHTRGDCQRRSVLGTCLEQRGCIHRL